MCQLKRNSRNIGGWQLTSFGVRLTRFHCQSRFVVPNEKELRSLARDDATPFVSLCSSGAVAEIVRPAAADHFLLFLRVRLRSWTCFKGLEGEEDFAPSKSLAQLSLSRPLGPMKKVNIRMIGCDLLILAGLLTATFKLNRPALSIRYRDKLSALLGEARVVAKEANMASLRKGLAELLHLEDQIQAPGMYSFSLSSSSASFLPRVLCPERP